MPGQSSYLTGSNGAVINGLANYLIQSKALGGIDCLFPEQDVNVIESLADNLQYISDLAGADVFIDVLSPDQDVAVVVAEAKPRTANSLYSRSVIGQPARKENEPAVFQTFASGEPSLNVRGISQEGVPIVQTVLPVKGKDGRTLAVLIMERDNSRQVQQEDSLKVLSETTQKLTDTLLNLNTMGEVLPTLLHDALLVTNEAGDISFVNKVAEDLFAQLTGRAANSSNIIKNIGHLPELEKVFKRESDVDEIAVSGRTLLVRSLPVIDKFGVIGNVYLLRDITELRKKEKQLIAKSAVIKEIHHRVKNNLQTIASLMRLQMRRINAPEAKQAFQESINRVKCIALVHEFFSKESPEIIEMKSCMARIAGMLIESMVDPGDDININVAGDKVCLPSELAIPVAIVTNELLQNALEHGVADRQQGNIRVGISANDSEVAICIADDGAGLPPGFNLEERANLGLQIATALVKENLGGVMEIVPGFPGTRAMFKFPVEGRFGIGEIQDNSD